MIQQAVWVERQPRTPALWAFLKFQWTKAGFGAARIFSGILHLLNLISWSEIIHIATKKNNWWMLGWDMWVHQLHVCTRPGIWHQVESLDFMQQKAGYLAFRRENSKANVINYDGKSFLTENLKSVFHLFKWLTDTLNNCGGQMFFHSLI